MYAVTDERISEACLVRLKSEGVSPILMPPAAYLQPAVASHTDMLFFLGFDRLFCHRCYYERNAELIDKLCRISGNTLMLSNEPTGEKYPLDVLFNACLVGKRLICNEKTVSNLILASAKEAGFEIINVPQGYTKCSVTVISDNAIITADKSIARACASVGIDVMLISEGYISLPPYEFGFIGGTSGGFGDKIYFCGSLSSHPDGDRISEFCAKHKKTAVSLSSGELQDVGSIYFLEA